MGMRDRIIELLYRLLPVILDASSAAIVADTLRSAGIEILADITILNLIPFSFGYRYAALLDKDPENPARSSLIEFFVPLSIF